MGKALEGAREVSVNSVVELFYLEVALVSWN